LVLWHGFRLWRARNGSDSADVVRRGRRMRRGLRPSLKPTLEPRGTSAPAGREAVAASSGTSARTGKKPRSKERKATRRLSPLSASVVGCRVLDESAVEKSVISRAGRLFAFFGCWAQERKAAGAKRRGGRACAAASHKPHGGLRGPGKGKKGSTSTEAPGSSRRRGSRRKMSGGGCPANGSRRLGPRVCRLLLSWPRRGLRGSE